MVGFMLSGLVVATGAVEDSLLKRVFRVLLLWLWDTAVLAAVAVQQVEEPHPRWLPFSVLAVCR